MLEKFFNEENEPNLFKISVSIKTKSGDTVKLDAIIQVCFYLFFFKFGKFELRIQCHRDQATVP